MLCGSCVRPPALPSLPCLRWPWASAPTSRCFSSSTASCSVRCPFPHPERVVRVERSYANGVAVPAYSGTVALFLRRTSHSFDSAAIYDYIPSNVNLVQEGEAIPLKALRTTSDFFHVFAMEPALGRDFNAGDMVQNAPGSSSDQQSPSGANASPPIPISSARPSLSATVATPSSE